jgi:hypothetical protein
MKGGGTTRKPLQIPRATCALLEANRGTSGSHTRIYCGAAHQRARGDGRSPLWPSDRERGPVRHGPHNYQSSDLPFCWASKSARLFLALSSQYRIPHRWKPQIAFPIFVRALTVHFVMVSNSLITSSHFAKNGLVPKLRAISVARSRLARALCALAI